MIETQIDPDVNCRIIKVHDHDRNFTFLYYEDEVEDIELLGLKLFIQERRDPIRLGVYDVSL
ncbi:hypothetical protein [Paraliobacillus ryukyuensis]|uniref:hypothetical protein n=1 Tax=Paraliobacillus ryukyuensis TaxID=200904 RepID=UPI00117F566D|nr:hypothetical protein [Paraliobacillus ryukyuensis]